jgi:hypothetical protein
LRRDSVDIAVRVFVHHFIYSSQQTGFRNR